MWFDVWVIFNASEVGKETMLAGDGKMNIVLQLASSLGWSTYRSHLRRQMNTNETRV